MKNKLILGALIALVTLGLVGGTAAFATGTLQKVRGMGKVTAVDLEAGTLTVDTWCGTVTLYTNEETVFHVRGVENPSLADIQVGDPLAGEVERQEDGTLLATHLAVVPPKQDRARGLGKVTAIDLEAGTLTVEARRGTVTLYTDENTLFRVKDVESPSLADIQVGDLLAGEVEKQDDDTLLATHLAVVPPKQDRGSDKPAQP